MTRGGEPERRDPHLCRVLKPSHGLSKRLPQLRDLARPEEENADAKDHGNLWQPQPEEAHGGDLREASANAYVVSVKFCVA